MTKLQFKFYASKRLPAEIGSQIQQFINQYKDAPIPETPTNSMLFLALHDNALAGFASLTLNQKSAELTSLFIAPSFQGKTYGTQLMLNILGTLSQSGCEHFSLSCAEELIQFFEHLGFIVTKEQHLLSSKGSSRFFELENPCPAFFLNTLKQTLKAKSIDLTELKQSFKLLRLCQDSEKYAFQEQQTYLDIHKNMLFQAQRQIWLHSDTILSPLLNAPTVRDSILRLAKRNAKAEIRILLEDDKQGAGYYNPTIDLAQKLTSFVEIRTLGSTARKPNERITTVDFNGSILRKSLNHHRGFAHYNNHLVAQRLREKFDDLWQSATPSMQLRRLTL